MYFGDAGRQHLEKFWLGHIGRLGALWRPPVAVNVSATLQAHFGWLYIYFQFGAVNVSLSAVLLPVGSRKSTGLELVSAPPLLVPGAAPYGSSLVVPARVSLLI